MQQRTLGIALALTLSGLGSQASAARTKMQTLECKSEDYRYRRCPVDGEIVSVSLERQTSHTDCVEGESYGHRGRYLWVDEGCAGRFEVSYKHVGRTGLDKLECKSKDYKRNECSAPGPIVAVQLLEQKSRSECRRGRSFGYQDDELWVDEGCAGRFEVEYELAEADDDDDWRPGSSTRRATTNLSCKSKDYKPSTCRVAGTITSVRLRKQKSNSPCRAGESYGYRGSSLWVTDGCAGDFEVSYKTSGEDSSSSGYVPSGGSRERKISCRSKDYKYQSCRVDGPIEWARVHKQKSNSDCIEGKTWGYRGDTLWVSDGCHAEFKVKYEVY